MKYKEARQFAADYDKALLATDPRFRYHTIIRLDDGSSFSIDSSFILVKNNYVCMFSEHHGYFVFDNDDVIDYCQYEKVSY